MQFHSIFPKSVPHKSLPFYRKGFVEIKNQTFTILIQNFLHVPLFVYTGIYFNVFQIKNCCQSMYCMCTEQFKRFVAA